MTPTFNQAIRYFVEVSCQSPLRTGGSERDTEKILRDAQQRPMLQGTSLAGAMRSWREDAALFGTQEERGSLIISNLVFDDQEPVTRPRLAINAFTGTAKSGHKFDVTALPTGTKGEFQIIWRGTGDIEKAARKIEAYLSALHGGIISLGTMKANGFGRVSLKVRRRTYNMEDPKDLAAWLLDDAVTDLESVSLEPMLDQETVFRVTAVVHGVLVKSASSTQNAGYRKNRSASSRTENIREKNGSQDAALIPSSSLKGTIRSQIRRISPHFGRDPGTNSALFGYEDKGGIAGVVKFSDGVLRNVRSVDVPRIRISRLTSGTMGRGLFTEVPLDAELTFDIRLPAQREAGSALVLYALRDLGLGIYELGSGTAVGRGRIKELKVQICSASGNAKMTCADNQVTLSDPDGMVKTWQAALTGGKAL